MSTFDWTTPFHPSAEEGLPPAAPLPAPPRAIAREVLLFVAVAIGFLFLFKGFVAEARWIPSESMVPQLQIHDRVLVSKVSYRSHEPRRGDIVVFPRPDAPPDERSLVGRWVHSFFEGFALATPSTEDYIKRVVALPGEVVEGREGAVYIDGRRLQEPYLPPGTFTSEFPPIRIQAGQLWVMGDNRPNSSDSRVFGAIERSEVVGRAILRMWPVPRMAFL